MNYFLISDLIIRLRSSVLEALYLKKKILAYEWLNEKNLRCCLIKNCLTLSLEKKSKVNFSKYSKR